MAPVRAGSDALNHSPEMPALVAGIHMFLTFSERDVAGRRAFGAPGHAPMMRVVT